MQRILKTLSTWLFLSVLLASCGSVTRVPTTTASASRTPIATNTSRPQPTATTTLSLVENMFTIPTSQGILPNTPTPIATPAGEAFSSRLRDLTEEEALNLVYEMNDYSYRNFPSLHDWWTDDQFVVSQEPVSLAIQEFLYRFPESTSAYRFSWQLAFINAILYAFYDGVPGNQYGEKWVLDEIQKSLNQGKVPPDQLETVLDQYWFDVAYLQPIINLFGDGKTAWFYVITPQVWAEEENDPKLSSHFHRGGLFIVVQEIDKWKYQIHVLENAWDFLNGANSLFDISDHNKNGLPEISLNLWRQGGSMCAGKFKTFEWRNNSFEDMTQGQISIMDCSDNYEYSMVNGTPSIIVGRSFGRGTSIFTWNGSSYEFYGYQVSNSIEKWSFAQSLSEEAQAIEAIFASGTSEGLSSSQIDFLRYRLGIVYALTSEISQAKQVLRDLADNPKDKTRTVYSDFAKNFLQYYSGNETLSLACKESREILDETRETFSSESEEELFGIPFDLTFGLGRLRCFDRDVFELLIRETPSTIENVPAELRRMGMTLYYAEKQDVNLDGLAEEWLIIFDHGMFVVLPDEAGYEAVELAYFWYWEDTSHYSNVDLRIERWNKVADPILTASTADELLVLKIGKNFNSTWLNSEYDVENVLLKPESDPAQFQVFYARPDPEEDYYGVPWSGYRWDPGTQRFRDDLIEYTLFIERDPDKAVDLVNTVYPFLMEWKDLESMSYDLPRYFYLCALTYEFSGDEQKAAEIYWRLWHDFPESHYALMARYKLEPVTP